MKYILLAKRSKRIFAAFIDLSILVLTSIITFLTLVYPFVFDEKAYLANAQTVKNLYQDSCLYLTQETGYQAKCMFTDSFSTVSTLSDVDLVWKDVNFADQNLSKDLYEFYTTKYTSYGGEYLYSKDSYLTNIVKVGTSESNIASIDIDGGTFAITLIDASKEGDAISYFLSIATTASTIVDQFPTITKLKTDNYNSMYFSLFYIIPVVIGYGLIFQLVLPLLSKTRRTLGKQLFKLDVIGSDGYTLRRVKLIPRALVYIFVEIILGVASFLGVLLISYTMFMFSKNRRAMHDFVAKSAVIDGQTSIYFSCKEEEDYYNANVKESDNV